jgi:hypothetical protein
VLLTILGAVARSALPLTSSAARAAVCSSLFEAAEADRHWPAWFVLGLTLWLWRRNLPVGTGLRASRGGPVWDAASGGGDVEGAGCVSLMSPWRWCYCYPPLLWHPAGHALALTPVRCP